MAKHIDYNHPLRFRGKSASRRWALYANDVRSFKPTHQHRVEGLIHSEWVVVERIHYNGKKYYEYWITHDNESFWVYQSLAQARSVQYKYLSTPSFEKKLGLEGCRLFTTAFKAMEAASRPSHYNTCVSCSCPAGEHRPDLLCKHVKFYLDPKPVDPAWKVGEGSLKNIYKYDVELKCDCKAYTYDKNKSVPCKHLRALVHK